MKMRTLISKGMVVMPDGIQVKDILIEQGKIISIGDNLQADNVRIVDAKDKYILPGAIDSHTHFDLDTGLTKSADDFASGTKAAIAGGTTTIIDFATQEKNNSLSSALEEWQMKAQTHAFCDYSFHMAITEWNNRIKDEMKTMIQEGITSFKLYMAYKNILQVGDSVIYDALTQAKEIGALIGFHCENGDIIDALVQENKKAGNIEPQYHMLSRPPEVEWEAINRLLTIGKIVDVPVWVVHLSTGQGLNLIEDAKSTGSKVVVETCPQYLLLDKSCYQKPDFEAAKYVISPPLREVADQNKLWNGLKNEAIDFISTDHCSFNWKNQKELGRNDFSQIPNGGPGVEDRLLLLYTYGVCEGRLSMEEMVKLLATNPAKKMGLTQKGSIEIGKDADLVILDPNHEDCFTATTQIQSVDYNAYEGMKRKGRIENVFLRGLEVVSEGKIRSGVGAQGIFQPRKSCI